MWGPAGVWVAAAALMAAAMVPPTAVLPRTAAKQAKLAAAGAGSQKLSGWLSIGGGNTGAP